MNINDLNGKEFGGGILIVKSKGNRVAIQLEKRDGIHTLGMIANDKVVKDYGLMPEILDLLNQPQRVSTEEGMTGETVKFIKTFQSGRKVSVIMENTEIPGTVEEMLQEFEANWKATVRKFDLLVEIE